LVQHLAGPQDGKARERDEVVNVGRSLPARPDRHRAVVAGIARPCEQQIERFQRSLALLGYVLGIDLLQTEDVGLEPFQCGSQDASAGLERQRRPGR
jgi:hypothetical protein